MAKSRKVAYLSGPMSGYPSYNYAAFDDAEAVLAPHYRVINPARNFDGDTTHEKAVYMRVDFESVLKADLVFVLPGWSASRGARAEVLVAQEIGIPIFDLETMEDVFLEVVTDVRIKSAL